MDLKTGYYYIGVEEKDEVFPARWDGKSWWFGKEEVTGVITLITPDKEQAKLLNPPECPVWCYCWQTPDGVWHRNCS